MAAHRLITLGSWLRGHRWPLIGLVLAAAMIGIVLPWQMSGRGTAHSQEVRYTRFWPSFTEVYTVQDLGPRTGQLHSSTHRLTVVDDFTWHDEIIADDSPALVGNYSDLRGGVLHMYTAQNNTSNDLKVGSDSAGGVEFNTLLFYKLYRGYEPGWYDAAPRADLSLPVSDPRAGRIAKVHPQTCTAAPNCPTNTLEWEIEYDAGSVHPEATNTNGIPFGGIVLHSEAKADGRLVHSFTATSLKVGPVTLPPLANAKPVASAPPAVIITPTPQP